MKRKTARAAGDVMDDTPQDLKVRTKQFALRIIRLYCALPKTTEAQVIGKQVLRSGTSVGAQYREGHRARTNAEFISKLESALQELEETVYWLELLIESEIVPKQRLENLVNEADELTAILVSSVKGAKRRGKEKEKKRGNRNEERGSRNEER